MKILCIIPPYLPSYFNAGHHLPVFQVGAYLRKHLPEDEITCIDCAALNMTWKEICDILLKHFDIIAVLNDFDAVDTFERFQYYKSQLSKHSKMITFGRLSKLIPRFFFQFGFDAVHYDGDYEAGVLSYIQYFKKVSNQLSGVMISKESARVKGIYLNADDWVLPDVNEIPYAAYHYMYKNDFNKFCGIPDRQELVIPVARGCPVGCSYCDVPEMQGKYERRLSVERVIDYIKSSFKKLPFEYVSFYAPTFTLNPKWVKQLCSELSALPRKYPWKCVTVLKTLDEELIRLMSGCGCIRISLGIESFTNTATMGLPKIKQDTLDSFKKIALICQKNQVELNCFIILGLNGDSPEDVKNTIEICLEYGARVRPAIYTPYNLMHENMTLTEVNRFNRQIFAPGVMPDELAKKYYEIFFNNKKDRATRVMEQIEKS